MLSVKPSLAQPRSAAYATGGVECVHSVIKIVVRKRRVMITNRPIAASARRSKCALKLPVQCIEASPAYEQYDVRIDFGGKIASLGSSTSLRNSKFVSMCSLEDEKTHHVDLFHAIYPNSIIEDGRAFSPATRRHISTVRPCCLAFMSLQLKMRRALYALVLGVREGGPAGIAHTCA